MDLENDGAAGTAAVWAPVSPPQIPLVDGFSFHQAPLPCAAAKSTENNEWGGGFMVEWAGGKRSEEWGVENGGDSWGVMGEEEMIVEGVAEAPPTPLIQARNNISASADVSPKKTATVATCVTNGWDPLHLNLQSREIVQKNLQEKPQWQVGQGNDGSCLTTSPTAATPARGGCASRRSLGGVTPSAATSSYAAGASFGPANAAPAIPLLTLPPSASFTGSPPSAAASHGTGTQTMECGGHVPAAWFTPTATSATNVPPASLMSALGSLQGKIAALQLLIPLVAQSGPEPAVREQQEAAAVGVAAVIQQVALAAVGLLPPRLQAQLLLPDIAGVVRAEQMRAEQEQLAQKYAELGNADQSAEKQQVEAEAQGQAEAEGVQQQPHMQEAMMMALAQALQLQEQQQQEQQQQQHEQKPLALPTAPSPPLPPAITMFAPDAAAPSAAPPPAPLALADPLAGPADTLLPRPPPPLASPVSAAASGAGASTGEGESEAGQEGGDKEGEQERSGGSKRRREYDDEMEAAMGEGPLKQAKVAESQAADASGEEAAPTSQHPGAASRSASGTASEAAAGAASGGESMGEGCEGSKADTDTVAATASASDSGEEAAAASSGGGAGWGAEGVRVGEWMVVEMRVAELTNDQMHFCDACGKGFKREANLRMHIKAHGRMTPNHPAASPPPLSSSLSPPVDPAQFRFSCPVAGCKRHREHVAFQPLKTVLCVRNHYRRSHCPKLLACSRCGGAKRFAVLADLRTHEKHCGLTSWTCSCGSRFSRKDKLMAHLVTFIGHSAVSPGNNRA
ncbi:unnamed protein product [Closterium sp. Yama58-4]|nr:unnamed protein product [Closterium sp. Yama58-4]